MKRFKNYLKEGTMSTEVSTALETVLGTAFESVSTKKPKILKDAMANDKNFKSAKKYWDTGNEAQSLKNLQALGNKIVNQPKSSAPGAGGFEFQKGGNLSKFWTENGGVNNTAKADIILGGKQYSVKNANGAQLMSGKSGESEATAAAASEAFGKADFTDKLIKKIRNLEQVTTKGYYASADNLKRLKQNADKNTTLFMLATALDKELVRYEKELVAYKKEKDKIKKDKRGDARVKKHKLDKLNKEWEKAWPANSTGNKKIGAKFKPAKKGWSQIGTLGSTGKPSLGRDLPKVLAKGKQPKELETKLSAENKAFTDFVDGEFQKSSDDVKKELTKLFKNKNFQKEFCYEAASGKRKFSEGAVQTANYMLSWQPSDEGVHKFKVKTYDMTNSDAKIISLYAAQMSLEVNWKSSSTSGHKGYNLYQNIRLGLGKLIEETDHLQDTLVEDFCELKASLQENTLNEIAFLSKLKGLATKFVASIKELGQRIFNWFKEAFEKISEAAEQGIVALGSLVGFEMDVSTNADKELSISI